MHINPYVQKIVKHFRDHETQRQAFCLGAEFENFVVDGDTYQATPYQGDSGVKSLLEQLVARGWEPSYEGENLMALSREGTSITLEPGAQLELSTRPCMSITEIDREYQHYMDDVLSLIEPNHQKLLAIGVQPVSTPKDITFIPKRRYDFMSAYFESKGKLAHTMMKCSASIQVSVDYVDEADFVKKFRVATALAPMVYMLFDNAPLLGGKAFDEHGFRLKVWENCDDDRCGIGGGDVFADDFGYEAYANYLVNTPPIVLSYHGELVETKDKLIHEVIPIEEFNDDELTHLCTMVFPDVRAKNYIEVRMADAVPYPINLSVVALWKGILYNQANLDKLSQRFDDMTIDDVLEAKANVRQHGFEATMRGESLLQLAKDVLQLAWQGLDEEESCYLEPAIKLAEGGKSPAQMVQGQLDGGLAKALASSVVQQ